MSKVLVTESTLTDIANAIRSKLGVQTQYRPGQMAAAILSIPTYPEPTGTVAITANGSHDVKDFETANVNVPGTHLVFGMITENGTFSPSNADGYFSVDVDVMPNLQDKTVTQNGVVTPDAGYDGLSSVTVNVQ